jgi:hypothetical protein
MDNQEENFSPAISVYNYSILLNLQVILSRPCEISVGGDLWLKPLSIDTIISID